MLTILNSLLKVYKYTYQLMFQTNIRNFETQIKNVIVKVIPQCIDKKGNFLLQVSDCFSNY